MIKNLENLKFYILPLSTQKAIQTAGQKNGTCAALIQNDYFQKIASAAKCTYTLWTIVGVLLK